MGSCRPAWPSVQPGRGAQSCRSQEERSAVCWRGCSHCTTTISIRFLTMQVYPGIYLFETTWMLVKCWKPRFIQGYLSFQQAMYVIPRLGQIIIITQVHPRIFVGNKAAAESVPFLTSLGSLSFSPCFLFLALQGILSFSPCFSIHRLPRCYFPQVFSYSPLTFFFSFTFTFWLLSLFLSTTFTFTIPPFKYYNFHFLILIISFLISTLN